MSARHAPAGDVLDEYKLIRLRDLGRRTVAESLHTCIALVCHVQSLPEESARFGLASATGQVAIHGYCICPFQRLPGGALLWEGAVGI
jgi:hypothetical protein